MIIDSHMHVVEQWPFGPVPNPGDHGRPVRLLSQMDSTGVGRALLISAISKGGDSNDFTMLCARTHPARFLAFPNFESMGSAHHQQSGAADRLSALHDRLGGFPGLTHYCKDYAWFESAEGNRFFQKTAELKLTVSIAVFAEGIVPLAQVARRFPGITFLVHHCGRLALRDKPAETDIGPLRDNRVAATSNLWFKLSGFHHMSALPGGYPYPQLHWIFRALYESVGPQRLVWGSDSPVSDMHMSYQQSLDLFRLHTPYIPAADRDLILGGNLDRILSWPSP